MERLTGCKTGCRAQIKNLQSDFPCLFCGWDLVEISTGNYTSASFWQRVAPTAPILLSIPERGILSCQHQSCFHFQLLFNWLPGKWNKMNPTFHCMKFQTPCYNASHHERVASQSTVQMWSCLKKNAFIKFLEIKGYCCLPDRWLKFKVRVKLRNFAGLDFDLDPNWAITPKIETLYNLSSFKIS